MSIRALSWAWQQAPPTVNAKLVLLNLADQANDEGVCWPFRATVAAKCAPMSGHQVKRALAELRAARLIEEEQRRGPHSGRWSANVYRLALPAHRGAPTHHGVANPETAVVHPCTTAVVQPGAPRYM